jgi:hypothetical protein
MLYVRFMSIWRTSQDRTSYFGKKLVYQSKSPPDLLIITKLCVDKLDGVNDF